MRAEVARIGQAVGDDHEAGVVQRRAPGPAGVRTTANSPGGVSVAAIRSATPGASSWTRPARSTGCEPGATY